jgi:hypothetical protein
MIDTDALERQFEKKCLDAGFIKLDKPIDTGECLNIASEIDDVTLFNTCWWQPMMHEMTLGILKEFDGMYYSIDITIKDNTISFSVSQGII